MINMGSPALFANLNFCSNYLLDSKSGAKTSFLTAYQGRQPPSDSVPYEFDVLAEFADKPLIQADFATAYIGKYGSKMPFQVPQLKRPPIVGGYIGAKSQSSREESNKLSDILANYFAQLCSSNQEYQPNHEQMPVHCVKENNKKNLYEHKSNCAPCITSVMKEKCSLRTKPSQNVKSEPVVSDPLQMNNCSRKPCRPTSSSEDKDKPPVKKAKMNVKANRSCSLKRRRHRKGRRKNSETIVQCEVAPLGYDPGQSSFESPDEVDCCIKLSNRFAPLSALHVWSESTGSDLESSDSPLLNMLSEMHLDDFEVEFNSASPSSVELCNVTSYDGRDSSLNCNSSIAFILSGNDDILASDSEDGSFASEVDEFQWQSFKADFEFFQEHVPLQDIIVGACNLHFDSGDLEALDNDIFLNDLECQPPTEVQERLREINQRWNRISDTRSERQSTTKVCFAPDTSLTSVHYIPSGPEECQARKSPWDQCYLDRCRFERRIQELEPVISMCLTPQHRKLVFQRLYGSEN